MSVGTVARKDLADAGRSRAVWAVVLVVVVFTAGVTGLAATTTDEAAASVFQLAFQLSVLTLPIVALILGKGAITAERESGSLRVLLSLPPSRSDILVGKFVGRTALMLVATLVGGVATGLVVVTSLGGELGLLVPFVAFLGLMGVAFVAVGVYMTLVVLWNLIQTGIQGGAASLGLIDPGSPPSWLQFLGILPPNRAALAGFEAAAAGGRLFAADPFASVWLPTLVLLAWLVVPVAAGYLRFRDAQIG